jgi:hypothetical protein
MATANNTTKPISPTDVNSAHPGVEQLPHSCANTNIVPFPGAKRPTRRHGPAPQRHSVPAKIVALNMQPEHETVLSITATPDGNLVELLNRLPRRHVPRVLDALVGALIDLPGVDAQRRPWARIILCVDRTTGGVQTEFQGSVAELSAELRGGLRTMVRELAERSIG